MQRRAIVRVAVAQSQCERRSADSRRVGHALESAETDRFGHASDSQEARRAWSCTPHGLLVQSVGACSR